MRGADLSRGSSESNRSNSCIRNLVSIYFLASAGWNVHDSIQRRNNSYTNCKCGHAASSVGSSSSGSYSNPPPGLDGGGRVRKMFTAN